MCSKTRSVNPSGSSSQAEDSRAPRARARPVVRAFSGELRRRRSLRAVAVLLAPLLMAMTSCSGASPDPDRLVATTSRLQGKPLDRALPVLALQATRRHAVLVVPRGRYEVANTIVLPARTTLTLDSRAVITGDLPGRSLVSLASSSRLAGGTLWNTAKQPGFDLNFQQSARNVIVSGTTFRGSAANAVYLGSPGLQRLTIERSRFLHVLYGILLNPDAISTRGLSISRNEFNEACADAIELNAATGGSSRRVQGAIIQDNRISGDCGTGSSSGFGIGLAGVRNFTVQANEIMSVRSEGVHLEDGTSDGTIAQNAIVGGGGGQRPAIAIYRDTARIVVRGNRVSHFDGSGVGVLWDSLGSARDVTIRDNLLQNLSGDGVDVAGDRGTGPFRVLYNRIENVAGNGIAVSGPHERSLIADNDLGGIRGDPIFQSLRGDGITAIEGNAISG